MARRLMELQCSQGCREGRFEAINAPLTVDHSGRYIDHDTSAATYLCALCQSVAIDIAAAARAMERTREVAPSTITCPVCGTVMLPPENDPLAMLLECPMCSSRFSVEEGMPRLHGSINIEDDA